MALHVILVHFNPSRLKVRKRLFRETRKRLQKDGAIVWSVEAAFSNRSHEVTNWWHPRHVQVRTKEELWNKEALLNIGANQIFKRCPDAKFIAWVDADLQFVRPNWVKETIEKLRHHAVVQMFSNAIDLSPRYDFMGRAQGFAKLYTEGQRPGDFERNKVKYPNHMHPGYAWAWRAEAWKGVGGMLNTAILGSADHHMACALIGYGKESVWEGLHPDYAQDVVDWQAKADAVVKRDIGYVDGLVLHHFHGYKEHRGYRTRVDILRSHKYSPRDHLRFDKRGMPSLKDGLHELRDDVRKYMGSRKEYDLTTALD